AMVAANQEPAPGQESDSRSQEAAPGQESDSRNQEAAPPQDSDAQVDVEIDPELLASILHIDLPEPPAPREAAPPPPRETPPPAAAQEAARPAARGATPLAGPAPEAPVRARSASSQVRAPRKMRLGEDLSARTGTARLLPHVWRAGSGLAVLLLLAQIVNHYRDELAATARFHRPITALYASLGIPLAPRWDLRAYEVRQLGASVEPASAGLIT